MHRKWLTNVGGWKGRIKHKCGWAEMLSPSQVQVQNNRAQNLCWPNPEFTDSTMSACASAPRSAEAAHVCNWFVSGGLPQPASGGHAATGGPPASHRFVFRPSSKQPPICSSPSSCCHHRHPSSLGHTVGATLWLSRCLSPCPCPRTGSSPTWTGTTKQGRIVVKPFDPRRRHGASSTQQLQAAGTAGRVSREQPRSHAERWQCRAHAQQQLGSQARARPLAARTSTARQQAVLERHAGTRPLTCRPQPGRAGAPQAPCSCDETVQ